MHITHYERQHKRAVTDLLFYSRYNQTHLDWYDTDQWLERDASITLIAWDDERIAGVMSAATPLNSAAWIRILGVGNQFEPKEVIPFLWDALKAELHTENVASLAVEQWVTRVLPAIGFAYQDEIITLRRSGFDLPNRQPTTGLVIRSVEFQDLPTIEQVDHLAFSPPWQMSYDELYQARRISMICTVALMDDEIIGYQMSTLYNHTGHLARLAVLPELQGRGIGASILSDLILRFLKKQVRSLTVNTQSTNTYSRKLYETYGFQRTGYDLPVWTHGA